MSDRAYWMIISICLFIVGMILGRVLFNLLHKDRR